MDNLVQVNNEKLVISSRDIADMINKRHDHLIRDIDRYIEVISQNPKLGTDSQNAKLRSDDFFIETSYTAGTGKQYKAYLLTKKGCDMIANKMTGEKGILFTATYIEKFYEMEKQLRIAAPVDDLKAERIATMKRNAKVREANLWVKLAQEGNETFKQVCRTYAANVLAEKEILALPKVEEKTYTATEVANMLGVTAHKIGRIANENGLKTEKYGCFYHDKSRYSNKEVESFRYNEEGIAVLRKTMQLAND